MARAEIPYMKSQNFEFLRPKRAVLADLAGFAERYAHEDPASSLIKQRSFVEHAVAAIYERNLLRVLAVLANVPTSINERLVD